MKPAVKKAVVQHVQEQHSLSQRRASQLVQCNRNTARHISRRNDDSALRARLRELAEGNLGQLGIGLSDALGFDAFGRLASES